MPEPSDQASQRQRRANWVGLRTLRQRPKLVGTLADGEPVYEVRSVRLLLRGQSPTFNRLVACERCGRDQAGVPVLSLADLDVPLRPVICANCVQMAGVSSVWEPEAARPAAERVGPAAAPVPEQAEPAPVAAEDGSRRLEALEHRFEAVGTRVEELGRLAEARQAAEHERRREQEATLSSLTAAVTKALAAARSEIASVSGDSSARVAALEVNLRESLAGLSQMIEAQRVDLTAIVREMVQAGPEMKRVVAATVELAEAQGRLEQRAEAMVGQAAASYAQELSRVEAAVDLRLQELAVQVAQVGPEMQRVVAATVELAEAQGRLEQRAEAMVGQAAASYAQELSRVEAAVDLRLQELAGQVAQAEQADRVERADTASRLDGLEKRLDRLAGQLAEQNEAFVQRSAQDAARRSGEGAGLVDELDLQLQGASERLAARSAGRQSARERP